MARVVLTVDDLDGTTEDDSPITTVNFSINGKNYVIDLGQANHEQFMGELAFWVEHATPEGKAQRIQTRQPARTSIVLGGKGHWWQTPNDAPQGLKDEYQALRKRIRVWAKAQGLGDHLDKRGRIPATVAVKWLEAEGRTSGTPQPAVEPASPQPAVEPASPAQREEATTNVQ